MTHPLRSRAVVVDDNFVRFNSGLISRSAQSFFVHAGYYSTFGVKM